MKPSIDKWAWSRTGTHTQYVQLSGAHVHCRHQEASVTATLHFTHTQYMQLVLMYTVAIRQPPLLLCHTSTDIGQPLHHSLILLCTKLAAVTLSGKPAFTVSTCAALFACHAHSRGLAGLLLQICSLSCSVVKTGP